MSGRELPQYKRMQSDPAKLGRETEANCSIDELLRLTPRYSLRALRQTSMYARPEHIDKLVESMRLAGLPE